MVRLLHLMQIIPGGKSKALCLSRTCLFWNLILHKFVQLLVHGKHAETAESTPLPQASTTATGERMAYCGGSQLSTLTS